MAGETRGNETKLTDELAAQVQEILLEGNYRSVASQIVGIHQVTFSKWMHATTEPYLSFQTMVLAAEAQAERESVRLIRMSDDTVDRRWWLSRKYPDKWAESRRINLSGRLDMGVKLDAGALKDDRARASIDYLAGQFFAGDWEEADTANPDGDPEPYDFGQSRE